MSADSILLELGAKKLKKLAVFTMDGEKVHLAHPEHPDRTLCKRDAAEISPWQTNGPAQHAWMRGFIDAVTYGDPVRHEGRCSSCEHRAMKMIRRAQGGRKG